MRDKHLKPKYFDDPFSLEGINYQMAQADYRRQLEEERQRKSDAVKKTATEVRDFILDTRDKIEAQNQKYRDAKKKKYENELSVGMESNDKGARIGLFFKNKKENDTYYK